MFAERSKAATKWSASWKQWCELQGGKSIKLNNQASATFAIVGAKVFILECQKLKWKIMTESWGISVSSDRGKDERLPGFREWLYSEWHATINPKLSICVSQQSYFLILCECFGTYWDVGTRGKGLVPPIPASLSYHNLFVPLSRPILAAKIYLPMPIFPLSNPITPGLLLFRYQTSLIALGWMS